MRKKIIAGNWKMNAEKDEAVALVNGILARYGEYRLSAWKIVAVAAPFPYIHYCASMFEKYPYLFAAAQNCSEYEKGAYTGEVSATIIASLGVKYVIAGHSERREYFGETDVVVLQKIQRALQSGMTPIFCCGEPLEIREKMEHFNYIMAQLENCIFQLTAAEVKRIVIAYEPVWAIGTGKTATPEQAQEVHAFIRNEIAKKYTNEIAEGISVLYGGSVNAKNAAELFSGQDIDGGLVGGASLKVDEFAEIIKALNN